MKRLFLMIVMVVLVILVTKAAVSHRRARRAAVEATTNWAEVRHSHEVRRAIHRARNEVRQAVEELHGEIRQAFNGDADDDDDETWSRSQPQPPLEEADGLPVRIVPGTRVTVAQAKPPVPPVAPARHAAPPPKPAPPAIVNFADKDVPPPVPPSQTETRIIQSQMLASEDRAKADARNALRTEVLDWLDSDISGSWDPPSRLVDAMVRQTEIKRVEKEYGTLYVAELKAEFSPQRRQTFVDVFTREQVQQRLVLLGGLLAFVLTCLAAISGYIRTDEATKGYYTNRLRMLTAAGVGAAGVVIYQMLA
jgi:hypothetical protein